MLRSIVRLGSLAFMMRASSALAAPKVVVLVSGAGGQTGQSLFRKLLKEEDFDAVGLCRTEESKRALIDSGDVPENSVEVCDVTDADALSVVVSKRGPVSALCIATSAKPKPTGETNDETGRPIFEFPGGIPQEVDWSGQKNQIDAMPPDSHIVLCSSMGGTDPDHPLNRIGRQDDGSGGNILRWKRKSEIYLTEQTDKRYTIVHPGGLLNEPGGERELVLTVNDQMDGTESRSVPREDVAEVMLQALKNPEKYAGRSFDLRAKPVGDGVPTVDFVSLIDSLGDANTDYSLGEVGDKL